jgi:hypothetical protein
MADIESAVPQDSTQAQIPVQDSIFKQSRYDNQVLLMFSHPTALLFHLFFRTGAIAFYAIVSAIFSVDYILTFVVTVLLLAFDFWTVKNVTGRLLVGLRWWNNIKEDGSNDWVFESKPPNIASNPVDHRVFWWSLYGYLVLWIVMAIVSALKLSISNLLIVAVAIVLNMANIAGYSKCDKEAKKRAVGVLGDSLLSRIVTNRFL